MEHELLKKLKCPLGIIPAGVGFSLTIPASDFAKLSAADLAQLEDDVKNYKEIFKSLKSHYHNLRSEVSGVADDVETVIERDSFSSGWVEPYSLQTDYVNYITLILEKLQKEIANYNSLVKLYTFTTILSADSREYKSV